MTESLYRCCICTEHGAVMLQQYHNGDYIAVCLNCIGNKTNTDFIRSTLQIPRCIFCAVPLKDNIRGVCSNLKCTMGTF